MMPRQTLLALSLLISCLGKAQASETVTVDISFDRWVYPFNATPGSRPSASTFGAVFVPTFDDRDSQIVFGFDVSSAMPSDPNDQLVGVTFRATTAAADTFVFDPTYDAAISFGGPDFDDGRPIELFGVGTRNGVTGITTNDASTDAQLFKEDSPFSSIPGTFISSRSVFAADYSGGTAADVSNTVAAGTDVLPWAVGQTNAVAAGESVPIGTEFAFELDLTDADVASYVSSGMNSGELFFALTSLHSASQTGPATSPSFHLDADGASLGQTAQLDLIFEAVPEPGAIGLGLAGLLGLAVITRRNVVA